MVGKYRPAERRVLCLQKCPILEKPPSPSHHPIFWLAQTVGLRVPGCKCGGGLSIFPYLLLPLEECPISEDKTWIGSRLFISTQLHLPCIYGNSSPDSGNRRLSVLGVSTVSFGFAAFLGILVESWENMSQGLLLWCQSKSTTPSLFLLHLHLLFHSFTHVINKHLWSTLIVLGTMPQALGTRGEWKLLLLLKKTTFFGRKQIHNHSIRGK